MKMETLTGITQKTELTLVRKLMDSYSQAIMMAWEKPLMEAHAKAICSGGGHILNVGFGMDLVDTAIQQYGTIIHTIVEAHPEVYDHMLVVVGEKRKCEDKIQFLMPL